jgi:hypothetical protein
MRKFNLELCQALLRQTNSIDETARLMSDYGNASEGFKHWRDEIIKCAERGELVI